jgi:1-pyrroline-5-carboxylate dehydrogenase
VFNHIWKTIGASVDGYRSYPRVVGETGGKDFILAHASADVEALVVAIVRGGYEFQGQKCSAPSRVYVPRSLWDEVRDRLISTIESIKMGDVSDFRNFMGAVIDARAFKKISGYIDDARRNATILAGGQCDDSRGFFIRPTLVETADPAFTTLCEEVFGPVVTTYVYDDAKWAETLALVDRTSPYALTGAIFARDRDAVTEARTALRYAAGNFYVNDKPTGAVVAQQPFGGARASGTNDKAGSKLNLVRWVSARTVKENLNPPHKYQYPFMDEE